MSFYDKLMRTWIITELGVDIPSIRDVMEKTCWGCGDEKDDLKYCKVCRIPKYCSKECQKLDWTNGGHKIQHKIFKEAGVILNVNE